MADRLAASTNSYHTYTLEEALAGIAAAGFSSVELTSVPGWTEHVTRDADANELANVKALLAKHGLTAVSLSGHSDLVTDDGVTQFRKALRLCKELGIPMITTSTGGHDASSAGSLDHQREEFLKRIGPLADEAAANGITICLETHGGLLATGMISQDLVKRIGKKNVGINYDAGNVIFYGATDPQGDLPGSVGSVVHVHAKDKIGGPGVWNFPAVGTGEIDYVKLFKVLDGAGFKGPVSVEVEFSGEPWPSLADVNAAMKQSYTHLRPMIAK